MESRNIILVSAFCIVLALPSVLSQVVSEGPVLNEHDKTRYVDCHALMKAGYDESGIYLLHTNVNSSGVVLPCEFRDGNAFTVILRRVDGSLSFSQTWFYYEMGFGHAQSNFWAGLAHIYPLTLYGNVQLQINMQSWGGISQNALYTYFTLEDRQTRYRLHIGGYQGSLTDDLSFNNNMPFSTFDAPDPHGCASGMRTGWWYNYCSYALPTGTYYHGSYKPSGSMYDGIFWKDWLGYGYSLKFISMTISHP